MNTESTLPAVTIDPASGPDKTVITPALPQPVFDKKVETASIKVLKAAFRKWKLSRKRGASLLVTRYTRHGRPVY